MEDELKYTVVWRTNWRSIIKHLLNIALDTNWEFVVSQTRIKRRRNQIYTEYLQCYCTTTFSSLFPHTPDPRMKRSIHLSGVTTVHSQCLSAHMRCFTDRPLIIWIISNGGPPASTRWAIELLKCKWAFTRGHIIPLSLNWDVITSTATTDIGITPHICNGACTRSHKHTITSNITVRKYFQYATT